MKHKLGAAIATILAVAITGATVVAQNQPSNPPEGLPNKTRLNLTDEQRTQMRQIREETRSQMDSVLTAEQREKLKAAVGQGQGQGRRNMRDVMSQLNLTQEQKDRIKQIQESSRQRMQSIFTPEQMQQMQQMRQNRQNRRNNQSYL